MDKLNLNLDDLNVDSFATDESSESRGTIRGQQFGDDFTVNTPSCNNQSCLETCYTACGGLECGGGGGGGGGGGETNAQTACVPCQSPTNIYEPCYDTEAC